MITISFLFGLGLLFLFSFIGSLGVPGGDLWMISAGALSGDSAELALYCAAGFLGSLLGDICAFSLGSFFADPVRRFLGRFAFYRRHVQSIVRRIDRAEFSLVFFSRFLLTGVGPVVNYACGLAKADRRRFILFAAGGDLLYAIEYPLIGYAFKEIWQDIASVLNDIVIALIIIIIAFFLVRWLMRPS